jgi:hypothetical protein
VKGVPNYEGRGEEKQMMVVFQGIRYNHDGFPGKKSGFLSSILNFETILMGRKLDVGNIWHH